MKKLLALLITLVLLFSTALLLVGCGGDNNGGSGGNNDDDTSSAYKYKVTVLAGNVGVAGATVVFENGTEKYSPVTTDGQGVATLELEEEAEITAYLMGLPSAYYSYYLKNPIMTEYTLDNRELIITVAEEAIFEIYTIYVFDENDSPVANQRVQMYDKLSGTCLDPIYTDGYGVAIYTVAAGNRQWQAQLFGDVSGSKVDFNSEKKATLIYSAR